MVIRDYNFRCWFFNANNELLLVMTVLMAVMGFNGNCGFVRVIMGFKGDRWLLVLILSFYIHLYIFLLPAAAGCY